MKLNFSKLFCLIGAVLCVPLFIFEKLTNIDPETGFFLEKGIPVYLFGGILTLVLAGIIIHSLWLSRDHSFAISNSRILGLFSLTLGIAMIADGALDLLPFLSSVQLGNAGAAANNVSAMILIGFKFLLALLSGFVFIRLAMGYFQENIKNRGSCAFLLPIIWALINCIQLYSEYPQIAGMADRVLLLVCLLTFTVFLVGQGRILSDVNMDRGVPFSSAFGLCAALSGLILVAGSIASFHKGLALPVYDLILCGVISAYCFSFVLNTQSLKGEPRS